MENKNCAWIFFTLIWVTAVFPVKTNAQQLVFLQGKVTDSKGQPLIGASITIDEVKDNGEIFFLKTNENGYYTVSLSPYTIYDIKVTYQGYKPFLSQIKPKLENIIKNIILIDEENIIDVITIKYQYKPVIIKKDTIIFNLDHYRDGSERKIVNLLEKLPGMVVEDGKVRFQGSIINQTLVEGKSFFGGGSRLAIENIPAEAVGKIEIISHFSEVEFMKDLLSTEELAMNMVLKDDHKNILFGDLEAAYGTQVSHELHTSLFSFSSDRSIQLLAAINNTGKTLLSLEDILRLQGGTKNYILRRTNNFQTTNLRDLTRNDRNFLSKQQVFSAISYQKKISSRADLNSFFIFNKMKSNNVQNSRIIYFTQEFPTSENRNIDFTGERSFGLLDLKLDYNISEIDKWIYRSNIQLSSDRGNIYEVSLWTLNNDTITNKNNETPFQINQSLEWNRKFSPKLAILSTVDYNIVQYKVGDNLLSKEIPAISYIEELNNQKQIHYHHNRSMKSSVWNLASSLIWSVNRFHQFISSLDIYISKQKLKSGDHLVLSNNNQLFPLKSYGFGNDITYSRCNFSGAIEYRWTKDRIIIGLKNLLQYTNQQSLQLTGDYAFKRWLYLPKIFTDYNFNISHGINFNAERRVDYPILRMIDDSYQLVSFNTLNHGNPHLTLEDFYTGSIFYRKFSLLKSRFSGIAFYTYKSVSFRNDLRNELRSQFFIPQIITSPNKSFVSSVSYERDIVYLTPKISLRGNVATFTQEINEKEVFTIRDELGYALGLRTKKKGWPVIAVDFEHSLSRLAGLGESHYSNINLTSSIRYLILNSYSLFAEFKYHENINRNTRTSTTFKLLNMEVSYNKKKSHWSYHVKLNNVTNTNKLTSNQMFDYMSSEITTLVLPRQILFGVNYSL